MRCKFCCGSKVELNNDRGYAVIFYAVYAGSEENDKYFQATPSGSIVLQVLNEQAASFIEIGKNYYIDFTTAP
jgi:hypothetical protein